MTSLSSVYGTFFLQNIMLKCFFFYESYKVPSEISMKLNCHLWNCLSVKCLSVKCLSVKCLSVKCLSVNCLSVNCLYVNCLSVKCLSVKCLSVNCLSVKCQVKSRNKKLFKLTKKYLKLFFGSWQKWKDVKFLAMLMISSKTHFWP